MIFQHYRTILICVENSTGFKIKNIDSKENILAKWLILVPTMFAAFMFALDETIANIALPHIAGSFSVSSQESIWILTSYLIASCLTIPMLDWLCRLQGRKNLFILMVFIFTASSFACGISTSMPVMIIGRFFSGIWRWSFNTYCSSHYDGKF